MRRSDCRAATFFQIAHRIYSIARPCKFWGGCCVVSSQSWHVLFYYHFAYWGRVTHICVSKLTSIGSGSGLVMGRRQTIFWTNSGILLIRILGTNFSGILSKIHTFSFKKIPSKLSSGNWRPLCLGLNVLNTLRTRVPCLRQWTWSSPVRVIAFLLCVVKALPSSMIYCQMDG